jgi:hypothetical protein
MQWWIEANEKQSSQQLGRYLGMYAMFFGLTFLAIVVGCWYVYHSRTNGTRQLI